MALHSVTMEDTILKLLGEKKYATLRDILVTMNPSDIAAVFDELTEDRLPLLYRLLPKELAADTFVEIHSAHLHISPQYAANTCAHS